MLNPQLSTNIPSKAEGDLRADGTVALTANWDAGSFEIRAETFQSDVTTGTAPLIVASTTLVTNLNADKVDGLDSTALVLVDGSQPLTANWDAGSFQIRAETFQSDVATGTAPLTVASTTLVSNLNAERFNSLQSTAFVLVDGTQAFTGDQSFGGNNVTNLGDVTFKTGASGGTLRTGTSAADKFTLQAYDVDGSAYVTVLELDAGNDPLMQVFADYMIIEDATDPTKHVVFDVSGATTSTTTTLTASQTANRVVTLPDATGTLSIEGHTHAASDITSGTLAHERGGIEADISSIAIGDIIAGTGTGTAALVTSTGHTRYSKLTIQTNGTVDYEGPQLVQATDGVTVTFNLAASLDQYVVLDGNRTLALSNIDSQPNGTKFTLKLTQDGVTGSRTVTWFSGISWAGGSAPTLTTTAGKSDRFIFVKTGTGAYEGYVVGQNI